MLTPSTSTFRKLTLCIRTSSRHDYLMVFFPLRFFRGVRRRAGSRVLRRIWAQLLPEARRGIEDHFDDRLWRGYQRCMVDLLRPDARTHSPGHKELGGRVDQPVFLSEEVPRRLHFPSGSWCLLLNTSDRDWPLCCSKKRCPFAGRMLRESGAKSLMRHPDESVCIRCQLSFARLRMTQGRH